MKGTRIRDSINKVIPRKTPWVYGGEVTKLDAVPNPAADQDHVTKRPSQFKLAKANPGSMDES